MMNSRWQASKIGFVNFWYYDEQEFPFANGRMLLRGANGSGKSVTMQSVIPLLLDGNMSPERLDPFGSRDRKMTSYLLEEDDERDERTGYIYMEFKRLESDVWLTIGMGLRARRGKSLDKWYFSLGDGRRIGKDFFLFKALDEKIPLSKKELENRIGSGGEVFERQADYMAYVNQQIFGFETLEDYREMLDLLIQLRTPKLSKDFKPSVVGGILSDSLQPLSDEDLQPMAEAIQNMDERATNLRALKTACEAAEKIQQVFGVYNHFVLYEKAGRCVESAQQLQTLEREAEQLHEMRGRCENEKAVIERQQIALEAEKAAKEKMRDSLAEHDAFALKQRERELVARIHESESLQARKAEQLDDKKRQIVKKEAQQKQEENRAFERTREIERLLATMQDDAETMAFEEHTFFADELQQALDTPYAWESHAAQLARVDEGVREGLAVLTQSDQRQREADEKMQQRDRVIRAVDAAQRREREREDLLVQVAAEWKEALYAWNGRNQELRMSDEDMRVMAAFAENYSEASDFALVRDRVFEHRQHRRETLDLACQEHRRTIQLLTAEQDTLTVELAEWEAHREPEPPRSEAVVKNRARLQELGVECQVFYKLIDFQPSLGAAERDRLEEALLDMGILDALVVSEADRERVMAADPGCADRYLFVQPDGASSNLSTQLELDDSVQDLFAFQRVRGILDGIAWNTEESATVVYADGSYQIGALSGKTSGEHRVCYIGAQARERARLEKIADLRAELEKNAAAQRAETAALSALEQRLAILQKEYDALPADDDLREAWRLLIDAQQDVQRLEKERDVAEAALREVNERLKNLQAQAAEIAARLYLAPRYEIFRQAAAAAQRYQRDMDKLRNTHERYLESLAYQAELTDELTHLIAEQEDILYEQRRIERTLTHEQAEHHTVQEQLRLTDYEKIRDELDSCLTWLEDYQAQFERCVRQHTSLENKLENLAQQQAENDAAFATCRRRCAYFQRCYDAELALGYVLLPEELDGEARKVRDYLQADCQTQSLEPLIRRLNERYYSNRDRLVDYQPVLLDTLFAELDEPNYPAASRLDLSARYRGERVPFGKLLQHLQEEIVKLDALLRDDDRLLFEDILTNTISRKIRGKINSAESWVKKMNALMASMDTSSGLKFHLRWRSRSAEIESQLDTNDLVALLRKEYHLMRPEEAEKLSAHFRSKVDEARRQAQDAGGALSFYQVVKEILDYRKWFEFQLLYQKGDERQRELTNNAFGTFSGGEKAMAMYVPLFSAVVAKYEGARVDAPRLISLDEAFAGVDNRNIRDMFRLMSELRFDFIINSQVLWGDYDTLDAIAVYQLLRKPNAKFVSVMSSLWNGRKRVLVGEESSAVATGENGKEPAT